MPKNIKRCRTNLLQNTTSLILLVVLFNVALLPSANALNAISSSPLQSISTTVIPQQQPSEVPQQQPPPSQQAVSPPTPPPQFPQISWDELEEAGGFIANGEMDSTLYTINGNWKSIGNWSMNVADGELTNFTATMSWYNGTAGHTHEFLNFEAAAADDEEEEAAADDEEEEAAADDEEEEAAADDEEEEAAADDEEEEEAAADDSGAGVDISAEDQTISVAGTMDVGTNGAVVWEDVPSEIVIDRGRIIAVSVDNEATEEHFSDQSVYGNLTSLSICSTASTAGPAMEVSPPGC